MKAARSPLPPVQTVRWDRRLVKLLLKRPEPLLADAYIQAWLQQRGGLAAVREFLANVPLKERQKRLLSLLLRKPDAPVDHHADELGVHRATYARWLRELYMVLADALTAWEEGASPDVPPATLSPAPRLRHQLPAPITDFVGRTTEMQQIQEALQVASQGGASAAIVGIHGMGGIGKTELACQIAHILRDAFPDAQVVLTLRGASTSPLTPSQALQAVIHALTPDAQLPDDADALVKHYRSVLYGQRVLILADDAHDAAQVRPLLPPPGCALLITSRQRFTLPGMVTIDLDQLPADAATTLLCTICPRLTLTEAQALAQTCGYLPLALRVSASMLHTTPALAITDYLAKLADEQQRLDQLRDPDDPQLDVAAALTLSYTQLDAAAQAVFRQLGVLIAGFATELALVVVEVPARTDVTSVLHQLLRRNLIMYDAARGRWRLHDLVRDLARSYLETTGEMEVVVWRYTKAAVQIAEEAQAQYDAGGDGVLTALARFDTERPHIDAARCWGEAHPALPEGDQLVLTMALATTHLGELRSDAERERIPQLERALGAAQQLGERSAEGQLLLSLGRASSDVGMFQHAISYWEHALDIFKELDDPLGQGLTLGNLGTAYARLGDPRRAIPAYKQALALFRALGDQRHEAHALGNLGAAYADLGEARLADRYLKRALRYARRVGDRRFEGMLLHAQSNMAGSLDAQCASSSYEGALAIAQEIGDRQQEGYSLITQGCAYSALREYEHAIVAFDQALTILKEVGDRWGVAECRWHYGLALVDQGNRECALPRLRASVAYMLEIGHMQTETRMALLARLEAGEEL